LAPAYNVGAAYVMKSKLWLTPKTTLQDISNASTKYSAITTHKFIVSKSSLRQTRIQLTFCVVVHRQSYVRVRRSHSSDVIVVTWLFRWNNTNFYSRNRQTDPPRCPAVRVTEQPFPRNWRLLSTHVTRSLCSTLFFGDSR